MMEKPRVPDYGAHLALVLDTFFEAAPSVSARQLSIEAGLGGGWISDFRRTRRATTHASKKVLMAVAARLPGLPDGGANVRRVLDGQLGDEPERNAA